MVKQYNVAIIPLNGKIDEACAEIHLAYLDRLAFLRKQQKAGMWTCENNPFFGKYYVFKTNNPEIAEQLRIGLSGLQNAISFDVRDFEVEMAIEDFHLRKRLFE